MSGGLMALCSVVKHGKREDLVRYAGPLLERVLRSACKEHTNVAIRRYYLKLVQRLGLIFLKTRVAAWRYQRGSRSITFNLSMQPLQPGEYMYRLIICFLAKCIIKKIVPFSPLRLNSNWYFIFFQITYNRFTLLLLLYYSLASIASIGTCLP
jgi:hypothetical protein